MQRTLVRTIHLKTAASTALTFPRIVGRLSSLASRYSARGAGRLEPALEPATDSRGERGQALIEFAFVLPIILVFLLGLVDFGIAIDRREVLQHAVYEGSRKAIPGATVEDIQDRAVAQSKGLLTRADVTVCYIDSDSNGMINGGDDVRVSADYSYTFTIGSGQLLEAFGFDPPSIAMTPKAESRLSNGPVASPDFLVPPLC